MELLPKYSSGLLTGFLVTFTERDPPEFASKVFNAIRAWVQPFQPTCAIREIPTTLEDLYLTAQDGRDWEDKTPMTLSFTTDILEHGTQLAVLLMHTQEYWPVHMHRAHLRSSLRQH